MTPHDDISRWIRGKPEIIDKELPSLSRRQRWLTALLDLFFGSVAIAMLMFLWFFMH